MGNVVERGLPALVEQPMGFQIAQRAQHDVELFHDVRRQADGARLIHDRALDRLPDPPCRVGGEAEASFGIELAQRVDEAEIALLDQVAERESAIEIMLGDADDKAQVALDHLLPRREVAGGRRACAGELFFGAEQRALPDFVQVDLSDVVQEIGTDAAGRRIERQIERLSIRLERCQVRIELVARVV